MLNHARAAKVFIAAVDNVLYPDSHSTSGFCVCGKKVSADKEKEVRTFSRNDWEFIFDTFWKWKNGDDKVWTVEPDTIKAFIKAMLV